MTNINSFDYRSIKGVIFDCDGVLVDSEPHSCYALNVLFDKYFNVDIGSDYSFVLGKTLKDSFAHYFKKYKIKNVDKKVLKNIYSEKDEIYRDLARGNLQAFDGVEDLIKNCLEKEIKIAVASSGALSKILFSLNETGLKKYFSNITSSDEVKLDRGKPFPDLFLLSAKKLNINPKKCLVIEDSLSGIKASKSAQMYSVGVTNTFSTDKLEKVNPDLIVSNVSELIQLLNDS